MPNRPAKRTKTVGSALSSLQEIREKFTNINCWLEEGLLEDVEFIAPEHQRSGVIPKGYLNIWDLKGKEREVAIFIDRDDEAANEAFPGCFVGTIYNVRSISKTDVVFNAKWSDTAASKACKLLFDQAASGSKMIKWGAWVEKAKKGEGIDLDATHVLKVIAPLRAVLGVEDE